MQKQVGIMKLQILLLSVLSIFAQMALADGLTVHRANCKTDLEKSICNLTEGLMALKAPNTPFWVGAFESAPVTDAIFLVLAKRIGKLDPQIRRETLDRIYNWPGRTSDGWPGYPESKVDFDATGIIVLSLSEIDEKSPELSSANAWFNKNGGVKKLSSVAKLHMGPLGILQENSLPYASPKMAALPKSFPFNTYGIGVARGIFIPFLAWGYFSKIKSIGPEAKSEIKLRGEKLGTFTGSKSDSEKIYYEEGKSPVVLGKGAKNAAAFNKIIDQMVPGDEEFWAKELLGWVMRTQQANGSWYVFLNSMFSMLALQEAQNKGLANFSEEIEKAWTALLSQRTKNPQGYTIQQPMFSSVWDTSNSLSALYETPKNLVEIAPDHWNESVEWLKTAQVKKTASWSQIMKVMPGGWSFDHNDQLYPDNDDTGAALHALADNPAGMTAATSNAAIKALTFILKHQNKDGGFPAWDTNMSRVPFTIMKSLFDDFPDVADMSQSDITSRLIYVMTGIKNKPQFSEYKQEIEAASTRACRYLDATKEADPMGSKGSLWYGDWAVNYVYGTSSVLAGLLEAQCWDTNQAFSSVKWIVSKQNADGGWGESPDSYKKKQFVPDKSSIFQTNAALFSLLMYYKYEKAPWKKKWAAKSIERAFAYINKVSDYGTHFDDSYSAVLVKGYSYSRYLHLPYYATLYTMSLWYKMKR